MSLSVIFLTAFSHRPDGFALRSFRNAWGAIPSRIDRVESDTNQNHEEIVENIEVYRCEVIKSIQ